jgi:hypothetical protein
MEEQAFCTFTRNRRLGQLLQELPFFPAVQIVILMDSLVDKLVVVRVIVVAGGH